MVGRYWNIDCHRYERQMEINGSRKKMEETANLEEKGNGK
jgi:hypothetical protein